MTFVQRFLIKPKSKTFSIIVNLCLILVSVFFSFILAELYLSFSRTLIPNRVEVGAMNGIILPSYPDFLTFSPGKSTIAVSKTCEFETEYKINSLGMRDREHVLNKQNLKILFVGDSYTEGIGVDQEYTYPYVIQDLSRGKFECFNAGIRGTCPSNAYFRIKRYAEKIKFDAVVIQFFANDFQDDKILTDQFQLKISPDNRIQRLPLHLSLHPLFRYSGPLALQLSKTQLYLLAASLLGQQNKIEPYQVLLDNEKADELVNIYRHSGIRDLKLEPTDSGISITFPFLPNNTLNEQTRKKLWDLLGKPSIVVKKDEVMHNVLNPPPMNTLPKNVELSFRYLECIKTLCDEMNIRLIIYCPPILISESNSWSVHFSSWCLENQVPFVFPLVEVYSAAVDRDEQLFHVFDQHMNNDGHKVVAHALYEYLLEYYSL